MTEHVGTDRRGIVHSLSTTAANVSDITQMPELLHGEVREVFGDQAYWSEAHRQAALCRRFLGVPSFLLPKVTVEIRSISRRFRSIKHK
jgi:hypothetical protein